MIILYFCLTWAIVATSIFLRRNWNRKNKLSALTSKLIFVFLLNFFLSVVCIYFNIKYVINLLKRKNFSLKSKEIKMPVTLSTSVIINHDRRKTKIA